MKQKKKLECRLIFLSLPLLHHRASPCSRSAALPVLCVSDIPHGTPRFCAQDWKTALVESIATCYLPSSSKKTPPGISFLCLLLSWWRWGGTALSGLCSSRTPVSAADENTLFCWRNLRIFPWTATQATHAIYGRVLDTDSLAEKSALLCEKPLHKAKRAIVLCSQLALEKRLISRALKKQLVKKTWIFLFPLLRHKSESEPIGGGGAGEGVLSVDGDTSLSPVCQSSETNYDLLLECLQSLHYHSILLRVLSFPASATNKLKLTNEHQKLGWCTFSRQHIKSYPFG